MLLPVVVSSVFDPLAGQDPYSLVFDLTGEVAHDRPEKMRLSIVFVSDSNMRPPLSCAHQAPNQRLEQPLGTILPTRARTKRKKEKPQGVMETWLARVSSHLGCN